MNIQKFETQLIEEALRFIEQPYKQLEVVVTDKVGPHKKAIVEWDLTIDDDTKIKGMYELLGTKNTRVSVILAVEIAMTPFGFLFQDTLRLAKIAAHHDMERNNIFEIICRYLIIYFLDRNVQKSQVSIKIMEMLNYMKNMEEIYAARKANVKQRLQ